MLSRGAAVYAGARNPDQVDQVDLPGAKPIALDITDPASVRATGDVTVLVDNADSSTGADLLTADVDDIRLDAKWSLTNALRVQLADQGIRVTGLHVGYMDTDMVRTVDAAKSDPADIARIAVDGIAAGAYQILADNAARQAQAALSGGVSAPYPQLP